MIERPITDWLPLTKQEVEKRGWDEVDIVLVSGDAYVDHPAFGTAVIGRIMESEGFRVAVIAQPNWKDDLRDFKKFGRPKYFFGVTAGCMDSMVNHYTARKRRRSSDVYADFNMLEGQQSEPVAFFGGKDYLKLFCRLTELLHHLFIISRQDAIVLHHHDHRVAVGSFWREVDYVVHEHGHDNWLIARWNIKHGNLILNFSHTRWISTSYIFHPRAKLTQTKKGNNCHAAAY